MGKCAGRVVALIFGMLAWWPLLAAESDFPVPASMQPAVQFWTRIYTEVDTNSGFLHDPEDLSVVYATVVRDTEEINATRRNIASDLRVLATGKRSGLTARQQQILSLWPENVSNERLARAAENVRWQLGQSDRFLAGTRRSGAYRQYIEQALRDRQLPLELAILPHVESSFHPGAYSSAQATGMWQFIRSTAQRFMQVDYVVDERLDPYIATHAAIELLLFNYNALGTWPLALTAYNHGANGMARAVASMGTTDIGRIVAEYKGPRFGFASRNFYAQFLAVLEVERRLEEFFGPHIDYDPYPEFVEVELPAYVDANTLAVTLGIDLAMLRKYNPALQPSVWSGTKRIPRGYRVKLDRAEYRGDLLASIGQIPLNERHTAQIPDLNYVVRSGDSLSVIAQRYNTSVSELVAINQLRDRNQIRVGQSLILPQAEGQAVVALASTSSQEPERVPANGRYEVRRGDSLSAIANRFSVGQEQLLALNNLTPRDLIHPGQTLYLTADAARSAGGSLIAAAVAESLPAPQQDDDPLSSSSSATEVINVEEERETPPAVTLAGQTRRPADLVVDGVDDAAVMHEGSVDEVVLARLETGPMGLAVTVDEATQAMEAEEQLLADLSADPADYGVGADNSIEIHAAETLGHYADWLDIRASDLRRLNNYAFSRPVIVGERLILSFDKVSKSAFERRRREYHRGLQQAYFDSWRIRGTERYTIRHRDLIVVLARQRSVPMWLFQQYNPDVDTHNIRAGQEVVFPVVEPAASS